MLCRQPGKWHISSHSITRLLALHQNVSHKVSGSLRRTTTATRYFAGGHIAFAASNVSLQPTNHIVMEKQCQEVISSGSPATDDLYNREDELPEWQSLITKEFLTDRYSPYVMSLAALLNGPKPWFEILSDERTAMLLAEHLVFTGRIFLASRVLTAAVQSGARLKIAAFEKSVHRLALAKRWKQVVYFTGLAPHYTGRQSRRLLNWRARAYVENRDYTRLNEILQQFASAGLAPSRRTFHIIIQGHLRNHDLRGAKGTLQEMKDAGFPMNVDTYSTIVAGYQGLGRDKLVQKHALDIARKSEGPETVAILNGLLRLCFAEDDIEGAQLILRSFDQGFAHFGGTTGADGEPSTEKLIPPDVATYTILITFLASKQDLQWLLALIEHMQKSGITIDEVAAAALIKAFYVLGAESSAVKLLCDIYRLDEEAKDYCIRRNIDRSNRIFGNISCDPSIKVLNAFLEGALASHGLDVVPDVLDFMHKLSVKPDVRSCEIVMKYLSRLDSARPQYFVKFGRLLKRMKAEPSLRIAYLFLASVHRRDKSRIRGWNSLVEAAQGRFGDQPLCLSNTESLLHRQAVSSRLRLTCSPVRDQSRNLRPVESCADPRPLF